MGKANGSGLWPARWQAPRAHHPTPHFWLRDEFRDRGKKVGACSYPAGSKTRGGSRLVMAWHIPAVPD
jgi:hypothetical protein